MTFINQSISAEKSQNETQNQHIRKQGFLQFPDHSEDRHKKVKKNECNLSYKVVCLTKDNKKTKI